MPRNSALLRPPLLPRLPAPLSPASYYRGLPFLALAVSSLDTSPRPKQASTLLIRFLSSGFIAFSFANRLAGHPPSGPSCLLLLNSFFSSPISCTWSTNCSAPPPAAFRCLHYFRRRLENSTQRELVNTTDSQKNESLHSSIMEKTDFYRLPLWTNRWRLTDNWNRTFKVCCWMNDRDETLDPFASLGWDLSCKSLRSFLLVSTLNPLLWNFWFMIEKIEICALFWRIKSLITKSLILSVTITIAKLIDTYLQNEFSTARSGNWSYGLFFFFFVIEGGNINFGLLWFWFLVIYGGEKKEGWKVIGLDRRGIIKTCLWHVQYTYPHYWWYEAASRCNWASREGGHHQPLCVWIVNFLFLFFIFFWYHCEKWRKHTAIFIYF